VLRTAQRVASAPLNRRARKSVEGNILGRRALNGKEILSRWQDLGEETRMCRDIRITGNAGPEFSHLRSDYFAFFFAAQYAFPLFACALRSVLKVRFFLAGAVASTVAAVFFGGRPRRFVPCRYFYCPIQAVALLKQTGDDVFSRH
jgi:hypothetical protein